MGRRTCEKINEFSYNLECFIEGRSEKIFKWPSEDIEYCSKKLLDRKCDVNSKEPALANSFKNKICFSLK